VAAATRRCGSGSTDQPVSVVPRDTPARPPVGGGFPSRAADGRACLVSAPACPKAEPSMSRRTVITMLVVFSSIAFAARAGTIFYLKAGNAQPMEHSRSPASSSAGTVFGR